MAAIEAAGLTKIYRLGVRRKPVTALQDLDLTVNEGEIFAYLGLNGAGKTTTIKLLLDHARPTSGSVTLFGIDAHNPHIRSRVGYLPDLPHFYRFLTGRETLQYCGKLFGLPTAEIASRSRRLFHLVGLEGREDEPLKGYSRGMLQRLGLAQALINNPDIVILDEPLGGLDPVGRVELRELIAGLKQEGRTVFFSSHILDDAQRIADRVGIIHQGRLLAVGALSELLARTPGWEVELVPLEDMNSKQLAERLDAETVDSDGRLLMILPDDGGMRELFRLAGEGRVKLASVNRRRMNLEDAFLAELGRWR